jgi:tRNA-uridine 2-sulfurtransferase
MSGGVDSTVSAHLLKEAGFAVTGIHLELFQSPGSGSGQEHADLEDACKRLDIPLVYLRLEDEFGRRVIDYFCREYSLGRTPNPCIRCNQQIKFGLLLDRALELGGKYLATGHYARVEHSGNEYRLLKGADPLKDQSYFLYVLGQKELARVLFPVGGLKKVEVKRLAAGLGLRAATRPESQDICFIADNDSRAFISAHLKNIPGEIVDTSGQVVGRHQGLAFYTIGQRQGMGVSAKERLYVIRLDSAGNRLVIGPGDRLLRQNLTADHLNWIAGRPPQGNSAIRAKLRYRSEEAEAGLQIDDGKARVSFKEPQRAIAPGQSIVFYQGEMVLGGGIIAETD